MSAPFNFNKLTGMAVARLGVTPETFYRMNPAEFFEAINMKNQRESAVIEFQNKTMWEAMRFHAMLVYNMIPVKKKALKKPQELCKFAWEVVKVQSPEEIKGMLISIFGAPKKRVRNKPEA